MSPIRSALLLVLVAAGPATGQGSPYDARRIDVGFDVDQNQKEAKVAAVDAGSAAEAAGIAAGDVVVRIGGHAVEDVQHLFYLTYYVLPPNSELEVVVRRGDEEKTVRYRGGELPVVPAFMAEGGRTVFRSDAEIFGDLAASRDHLERAIRKLAAANGQTERLAQLEKVLVEDVDRWAGFYQLDAVRFARRNPFKAHRVADRLAGDVRAARWAELPHRAARWLDAPIGDGDARAAALAGDSPAAVLERARAILEAAEVHRARAFAALSPEEQAFVLRQGADLMIRFIRHIYVSGSHQQNVEANLNVVRLAKRVDHAELARMAAALAGLWDLESLRALGPALAASARGAAPDGRGVEGDVLAWLDSPAGPLVVGGPGPNVYRGTFAFVLDVGGDDVYEPAEPPRVGAILDLAGNDRYRGGAIALGAGWGGAGILVDAGGDDAYELVRLGQGFGFLGFGLLLDAGGSDAYTIGELGQGAGLFGIGALLDLGEGDDRYVAKILAQGVGGPKGLGLLYEAAGRETYACGGTYPSVYGEKDVFQGLGQGIGIGFRRDACGGIGVLVDAAGDDRYEAGNFSQGMGYFEGLGLLADDAGDDEYSVYRYGQGSGCHYAVGVLLDGAGDDRYQGRIAANQGAAWDAGVGVLVDAGGNDRYAADGLSIGAASMNAIGIVFDAGGTDEYTGGGSRLGHGSSNSYWHGRGGAPSYGVLVDVGSTGDRYGTDLRGEDRTATEGDLGLFADASGDLVTLLAGDPDADLVLAERRRAEEEARRQAEAARRDAEAKPLYEAAEALAARGDYEKAIDAFERLAASHGDVPWGRKAAARAAELAADPEVRRRIEAARADAECRRLLTMGKNYFYNGKKDAAAEYFRKVADGWPGTEHAREAREWLKKLGR